MSIESKSKFDLEEARKKLRVAWVSDVFDEVSGIMTDTIEFYELAKRENFEWYPVTCYNKELYPFKVFSQILKIPTGSVYSGTYMFVPQFLSVVRYLREKKINVIVSNTPATMGLVAMAAARYLNIPWVDIYHTDVDFYSKVLSRGLINKVVNKAALMFVKQYQKRADLIFVRTKDYHEIMVNKGHKIEKIRNYPAGVNIDAFNPSKENRDLWQKFGIDKDRKIILFVGRITKVKDIHFALEFFQTNNPKGCELVIVGNGPEKKLYEDKFGSHSQIHFLGIQQGEELKQIYASSDLHVLPSASETLGKTILEALASNIPVLVSDMGGPKDYVKENINGRIFHGKDQAHFNEIFDSMLKDESIITKLKKQARSSVLEYTDERLFNRFVENILELV